MALARFLRCLKYARVEVRSLTRTLRLPPALSDIFDGLQPDWLKDVLEYLPCLQCLMVSKLAFLDHNAMTAWKKMESNSRGYNLRLLLAQSEPNTTSAGLAEILMRFPRLIYLDLSYTTPARDHSVLSCLSRLENLQVLKLRSIGLKDADAEVLANAMGLRVRFLDVRNNWLTDVGIRVILQACFVPLDQPAQYWEGLRGRNRMLHQRDLTRTDYYEALRFDFLRSSDLDEQYMRYLIQPGPNHHWIEDLLHTGITHLYVAGNPITTKGVASLLASARLHALDVGTVNAADFPKLAVVERDAYPCAENLIPILGGDAGDELTMLRIHHAVATAKVLVTKSTSVACPLPHLSSQRDTRQPAEGGPRRKIDELPAESHPVTEPPGTFTREPVANAVLLGAMNPPYHQR